MRHSLPAKRGKQHRSASRAWKCSRGGSSDSGIQRDRLPTATISKRCYHVRERVMPEDESMRRPFLLTAIMLAAIVDFSAPTAAQTWPTRPLTLVVPFAAGGPSDVAGRIIAQRLSE